MKYKNVEGVRMITIYLGKNYNIVIAFGPTK